MAEGTGSAIDPSGEAREMLQTAVVEYGIAVLSSPAIIEGICEDRLPDFPREASLIGIAARADVAAMLQQRAVGVGPDTAVTLTAATLAESRSLDPAASVWVVKEFARALGYQLSDDPESVGRQPGDTPTVLPTPPGPHPATERAILGSFETVTTGSGTPPDAAGTGVAADGATGPGGAKRHRPRPSRQRMLAVGAVPVLLIVYLIIAGTAHLAPFGPSPAPVPSPTPSPAPSHPTSSPTPFQPTAGDRTLTALIPGDVSADGSCSPVHDPQFGSTAEMHCDSPPNTPAAFVDYYLFGDTGTLKNAYATFLSAFAKVPRQSGPCHHITGVAAFKTFAPCETRYSIGSTSEGRVVEYVYKGSPDISTTFDQRLVLIDMQGGDGNSLLKWWDHSPNWINSGGG